MGKLKKLKKLSLALLAEELKTIVSRTVIILWLVKKYRSGS